MSESFWIALATGTVALLGALGSQAIAARAALRSKKMDTLFLRRAEAYRQLYAEMAGLRAAPNLNPQIGAAAASAVAAAFLVAGQKSAPVLCNIFENIGASIKIGDKEKAVTFWDQKVGQLLEILQDELQSLTR